MKTNERLIGLLALMAGGWYLYTRSKGLTLTGQIMNPMIAPTTPGLSTIQPNNSLNTLATNVFSGLAKSLQSVISSISHSAGGNAPNVQSASSTGITAANVASWGLQVPADEPAPPVSGAVMTYDDGMNAGVPFWNMPSFNLTTAPYMPWTLDPSILGFDPSYIPPPPGA